MDYITHHRFKGTAICGRVNIPYGTVLTTAGDFLLLNGKPICARTSETAKLHFSRNDDGKGLERGAYTYAIAYAPRDAGNGHRFTESEIELLELGWKHFLRQDVDTILFNEDFFAAELSDLQELADELNIKPKRK